MTFTDAIFLTKYFTQKVKLHVISLFKLYKITYNNSMEVPFFQNQNHLAPGLIITSADPERENTVASWEHLSVSLHSSCFSFPF